MKIDTGHDEFYFKPTLIKRKKFIVERFMDMSVKDALKEVVQFDNPEWAWSLIFKVFRANYC